MVTQESSLIRELGGVVIDVNDIEREGKFWGGVLGVDPGPLRHGGQWLTIGLIAGGAWLVLQRVPEGKVTKNRVHLDFRVDDVVKTVKRITELGGRQLSRNADSGGVVMADPEGNEFCVGAFRRNKEGKRVPL